MTPTPPLTPRAAPRCGGATPRSRRRPAGSRTSAPCPNDASRPAAAWSDSQLRWMRQKRSGAPHHVAQSGQPLGRRRGCRGRRRRSPGAAGVPARRRLREPRRGGRSRRRRRRPGRCGRCSWPHHRAADASGTGGAVPWPPCGSADFDYDLPAGRHRPAARRAAGRGATPRRPGRRGTARAPPRARPPGAPGARRPRRGERLARDPGPAPPAAGQRRRSRGAAAGGARRRAP